VKIGWIKREEKLCVVCIQVMDGDEYESVQTYACDSCRRRKVIFHVAYEERACRSVCYENSVTVRCV